MDSTTFESDIRGPYMGGSVARRIVTLALVCLALLAACDDEDKKEVEESSSSVVVAGEWLYRSFYNDNDELVRSSANPAMTALSLLWAEGIMTLEEGDDGAITGSMVFAPGIALDLTGEVVSEGDETLLKVTGVGVEGTPTAAWRYSIEGWFVSDWDVGEEEQRPSIVGSVVNTVEIAGNPPIGAALGTVGSFMLVRRE